MGSWIYYGTFFYNYNTFLHRMSIVVAVGQVFSADNPYIIPNTAVFIQNSSVYIAVLANPYVWDPLILVSGHFLGILVKICTHYIRVDDRGTFFYPGTVPYDGVFHLVCHDNAAITKKGLAYIRPVNF